MSKIIRMTPEYVEECRNDFEKALAKAKLSDGKISFTKTFAAKNDKATIFFTTEAWTKMVMLLQEFNKEVAWHGVAHRVDSEETNAYMITDILVYPQEVTGSTVEMDTEKYALWLQENDEDERFYNIHMQGHSHVNMAPNPSSVDLNHQEEILEQLGDDNFYIFMIYNKSFKRNIKIYDMKKNTLFENGDIEVKLYDSAVGFDEFISDAKAMVKERTYRPQAQTTISSKTTEQHSSPYNPLTSSSAPKEKPRTSMDSWRGDRTHSSFYDDDYDGACGSIYDLR